MAVKKIRVINLVVRIFDDNLVEIEFPALNFSVRANTLRQAWEKFGNKLKRIKKEEYEKLME